MQSGKAIRRRRSAQQPTSQACLECQKRKTRCNVSAHENVCSYCKVKSKACIFEAPRERTPLTRQNLDAAEQRIAQLEDLLRSAQPQLDIDEAANGDERVQLRERRPIQVDGRRSSAVSDDYEWHEVDLPASGSPEQQEKSTATDGMASLPAKGKETGYLGTSAASNIVQAISTLLPDTIPRTSHRQKNSSHIHHPDPQQTVNLLLLQQLTQSALVAPLVDAYFKCYNCHYPILHEKTFRDRCQTLGHQPTKSNFQITYYMVLALGQWLLSSGPDQAQRSYYAVARSLFTVQMLEAGTLGTVQALILMGNYLQKMDRPNTGYNLIGIAHRMSIGLGLYRETPSRGQQNVLARERRRQVFWTLYCFDSGFSITTGRPTTISDAFIDARLPRNVSDSQCDLTTIVPDEVDFPTTYSAIIEQSKVAIIANEIQNGLMSTKTSPAEIEPNFASKIDAKLTAWKNSLPQYFLSEDVPSWFRGPREILLWKEQNLRILLWQAIERNPIIWPGKEESRLRCGTVALGCVFSITSFCTTHPSLVHTGISWYATYFLFQATLVLLLHELQGVQQAPPTPESSMESVSRSQAVSQARECLEFLGQNNKSAARCLAVLDRVSKAVSSPNFALSPNNHFGRQRPPLPSHNSVGSHTTPDFNLHNGPSPETAAILGDWSSTADPSLNMFLGDGAIQPLFSDFDGFPATMEQDSFDYVNYGAYDHNFF